MSKPQTITLEEYLTSCAEKGVIEFRLVAHFDGHYTTTFYLHALGHDCETLDYEVDGDRLIPRWSEEAPHE